MNDYCLYIRIKEGVKTYLLLFVDDLLIFGNCAEQIKSVKSVLGDNFDMKDLGIVKDYLGIEVKRDVENLELSQMKYLVRVLDRFGMSHCKPMSTPMDKNINVREFVEPCNDVVQENMCRQITGCLMYAVSGTRPDLCYSVSLLSRYQSSGNEAVLEALKRVLRYVKGTLNLKLVYKRKSLSELNVLSGCVDANWAGDDIYRKSTSGFCLRLCECIVMWGSKKQSCVSLSSTEAEYVALCEAAMEACWLRKLVFDFEIINNIGQFILYEDNQSCIQVAKTTDVKRLKHIDTKYHFVREMVKSDVIKLCFVKSQDQVADIFTKSLGKETFLCFRDKLCH